MEKDCRVCKHFYFVKKTTQGSRTKETIFYCNPLKEFTRDNFDLSVMCQCGIDINANNCRYYKRKWYKFWVNKPSLWRGSLT